MIPEQQYDKLSNALAGLSANTCPDCGDPSPGGVKCRACREYDGDPLAFAEPSRATRAIAIAVVAVITLAWLGNEVRAARVHTVYIPSVAAGPTLAMSATSWAATPTPAMEAPTP